jgi:glycosyltransferase involved in cell wall biosynthesis
MQPSVLIVSHDRVGRRMSGQGIRYWEFARALSCHFRVTLAVPDSTDITHPDFDIAVFSLGQVNTLIPLVAAADVSIMCGVLLGSMPDLADVPTSLVIDMFAPYNFETIEIQANKPLDERLASHIQILQYLNLPFRVADFVLCSGERQRDFFLGVLEANGRINPYVYEQDKTLRNLIDVVGYGLPSELPSRTRPVLKGVYKNIAAHDKVILWYGGIWAWYDPLTLLRAMKRISEQRDDVKLVFLGVRHPAPDLVGEMEICAHAFQLSKELNLYERTVFFEEWVPYEERANYLLEADLGISFHFDHLEGRFCYRTRTLDFIWAGLPFIATAGDTISQLVNDFDLGRTVGFGDDEGLAVAILDLLDTPDLRVKLRPGFERLAREMTWEKVTEPLVRFCAEPRLAPDRAAGVVGQELVGTLAQDRALAELEQEVQHLCDLLAGYERGRFMRLMRWIKATRLRLAGERWKK